MIKKIDIGKIEKLEPKTSCIQTDSPSKKILSSNFK